MNDWLGFHFLSDAKLANGDGRPVIVGETLTVDGLIVLCMNGLHASNRAIDALKYAPGTVCCRVRLSGTIVDDDDKSAASERTALAMIDATDVLRLFARQCALDVAHLWDMPDVVREYLETGDEAKQDAAYTAAYTAASTATYTAASNAASNAACNATCNATCNAAYTAASNTARGAAYSGASTATYTAASNAASNAAYIAAWDAAYTAAWHAAMDAQNTRLENLLLAAMEGQL